MNFQIHLTILISLLLGGYYQSCGQSSEMYLQWHEHRLLNWDDFSGTPDQQMSSHFFAMTHGTLGYRFERLSQRTFKLIVEVTFNSHDSWHIPDKVNSDLLAHEQLHFDIYELYARIFIRRLMERNALQGRYFSRKVSKIFNETFSDLKTCQLEYDRATNHSRNAPAQRTWNAKIEQLMNEHRPYKQKELIFNL